MSKLILESLDSKQFEVFQKLEKFKDIGVLGGGTALALQIGHRKSFDFDIFTFDTLTQNLWPKSKRVLGQNSYRTLDTYYQLNITTPESVYVTFFHDDEYKSLYEPVKTTTIDLMDIRDIAANKAFTIGRRPKWRDYVDMFFLIKDHLTINDIVSISNKKFGNGFSEKLFLEQLTYWGDITDYDIKFIGQEIKPKKIKDLLLNESSKIMSDLFKGEQG